MKTAAPLTKVISNFCAACRDSRRGRRVGGSEGPEAPGGHGRWLKAPSQTDIRGCKASQLIQFSWTPRPNTEPSRPSKDPSTRNCDQRCSATNIRS